MILASATDFHVSAMLQMKLYATYTANLKRTSLKLSCTSHIFCFTSTSLPVSSQKVRSRDVSMLPFKA